MVKKERLPHFFCAAVFFMRIIFTDCRFFSLCYHFERSGSVRIFLLFGGSFTKGAVASFSTATAPLVWSFLRQIRSAMGIFARHAACA
ncbi:MAG: hypothetical protein RSD23_03285 [Ruthenibacterium sp.]